MQKLDRAVMDALARLDAGSVLSTKRIAGGSISQAFKVDCERQSFFLKTDSNGGGMFEAELVCCNASTEKDRRIETR